MVSALTALVAQALTAAGQAAATLQPPPVARPLQLENWLAGVAVATAGHVAVESQLVLNALVAPTGGALAAVAGAVVEQGVVEQGAVAFQLPGQIPREECPGGGVAGGLGAICALFLFGVGIATCGTCDLLDAGS